MLQALQSALSSLKGPDTPKVSDRELEDRLERIHEWPIEHLLEELSRYELPQIRRVCQNDPWLSNFLTNLWEYNKGETTLTSYPWNICLPIADVCNASCTFCNSWLRGRRWMQLDEVEKFAPLIRHAKMLGLAGHGEPLIHPEFDALSRRFSELLDPRSEVYLITNGYLISRYESQLEAMRVRTYNISLNAVTQKTHETVMGLGAGAFERVIEAVKRLVAKRVAGADIEVNLSLVVLKQNLHEIAPFVSLANDLGVSNIYIRTLRSTESYGIIGLNYHTLAAADHLECQRLVDEGRKAIQESAVPVDADPDSWALPVFSPDDAEYLEQNPPKELERDEARRDPDVRKFYDAKFARSAFGAFRGRPLPEKVSERELYGVRDPFERSPRLHCTYPYYNLNLNDFEFKMVPCCHTDAVPGFELNYFDGSSDFFEAWNTPAFVELRRSLVQGPLLKPCKVCPTQGKVDRLWDFGNHELGQALAGTQDSHGAVSLAFDEGEGNGSGSGDLSSYWSITHQDSGQSQRRDAQGLHVQSTSKPYDWSVQTAPLVVSQSGSYCFTLKFQIESGSITFGITDADGSQSLAREGEDYVDGDSSIRTATVDLEAGQSVRLLISNDSIAGRSSRFLIKECRAFFSPAPGNLQGSDMSRPAELGAVT